MFELSIGSINPTSIKNLERRLELERAIQLLALDVCFVQETRLIGYISSASRAFNYHRNDTGAGTAVLYKKNLKATPVEVGTYGTIECAAILLKGRQGKNLCLASLYVHCNAPTTTLKQDLDSLLTTLTTPTQNVIIGGDLNNNNRQGRTIANWLNQHIQTIAINSPPGKTFRTGSKIDHFLTTHSIYSTECTTKNLGHEHRLIQIKASTEVIPEPEAQEIIMKWHKVNLDEFQSIARSNLTTRAPQYRNLTNNEIETLIDQITADINKTIEQAVPTGARGMGRLWTPPDSLDNLYRERRRFKTALTRTRKHWRQDTDKIEHLQRAIRKKTREIDQTIEQAQQDHIAEQLKTVNNNTIFRTIKAIARPYSTPKPQKIKNTAGQTIDKIEDTLTILKQFYTNLYKHETPRCSQMTLVTKTIDQLDKNTSTITTFSTDNPADKPKNTKLTTIADTLAYIRKIPNKTSTGHDNIPNIIIKKLPLPYIKQLTIINNHCLNNSHFPKTWKFAKLITLPKKRGICDPTELRPISMTSNLGKILECTIIRNLQDELKTGTIPDYQFGFQTGHSTIDALHILNKTLEDRRDQNEITAVCSLDVRKAFDSVWHDGLIYKLAQAEAGPWTCRIVRSFLAEREAFISSGKFKSEKLPVRKGVPQGTRLGPILYNIFTADFDAKLDKNGRAHMLQYADDTLLMYSSGRAIYAVERVKELVNNIEMDMNNWGIEINRQKTKLLIAKPRRGKKGVNKADKGIASWDVKPVKHLKYLGITFDQKGTFREQARIAGRNGRQALGACRRILRSGINIKHKKHLYKSLIRSRAAYASPIWFREGFNSSELDVMERWAFRYALNVNKQDNGHFVRNQTLYEMIEMERFSDFATRTLIKHNTRIANHTNPLVLSSVLS